MGQQQVQFNLTTILTNAGVQPANVESVLQSLFSWDSSSGLQLTDVIAHAYNQTLLRDGFQGAWADAWYPSGTDQTYGVKLTSPMDDLSGYLETIPALINAGLTANNDWMNLSPTPPADLRFLRPFGLALANYTSVQLLHYPPLETFSYMDYLYSPTNRRWESLLVWNNLRSGLTLLESILDVVPIAAPGGSSGGKEIAPYNNSFIDYGTQVLKGLLTATFGGQTLPVVAYGSPVRDWLQQAFPNYCKNLQVLSLPMVPLGPGGAMTPILCANHPSEYLYYTDGHDKTDALVILQQDLIAAGWQATMAGSPSSTASDVLSQVTSQWKAADLDPIYASQNAEFGYAHTAGARQVIVAPRAKAGAAPRAVAPARAAAAPRAVAVRRPLAAAAKQKPQARAAKKAPARKGRAPAAKKGKKK